MTYNTLNIKTLEGIMESMVKDYQKPNHKPSMIVGKKFLQNLYEKEGKEMFKSMLENCHIETNQEGLDYVNSLNLS